MSDASLDSNKLPVLETNPGYRKRGMGSLLSRVVETLPTVVVLVGAALTGWWGHQLGWKLPKFSQLMGKVTQEDDWCSAHNVPESVCVECDDALLPKGQPKGWCAVHGVPECVLEFPELAQTPRPTSITQAHLDLALRSLNFASRPTNNPRCQTHLRRIQFATAADADKAGIAVEPVWKAPAVESITAPGELGYDQTRVAHLSARSPGTIGRVFKHLGQEVKAGDVLALVDAAEVGKAKADLLQAMAAYQVKLQTASSLRESGAVVPAARLREADAAVIEASINISSACQSLSNLGLPVKAGEISALNLNQLESHLQFLGIPPATVAQLGGVQTNCLLPLVAPLDGKILSREVVAGEVVDTARILFEVVDTRSLWLTLDIRAEDAFKVKSGQKVVFTPDGGQGSLQGAVAWKSTLADPKTRTVKIRAEIPDAEGKWYANTFGSGRIVLREEPEAVSVPTESIQFDGCCHLVFVRDKSYLKSDYKIFHVRKIRIGATDGKTTEVIAGVLPGELVVTQGSGLLLTELLRGSLGEGCACHPKK